MTDAAWAVLTEHHNRLKERLAAAKDQVGEHATGEYKLDSGVAPEVNTAVDADKLQILNEELLATPEGFETNRKLAASSPSAARRSVRSTAGINWAHAEALAFASLLERGDPAAAHRPGHRARHVQPAPPGPARREDRPRAQRDPAPAGRARDDGAAQQPAVGDGLHRLRVRLLDRRRRRRS